MNRVILPAILSILFLQGCFGGTESDSREFASAIINIELLYAETDEPIAGEPIFVQVREEGQNQWIDISEYTSDDSGKIEVNISSTSETKLTHIRIQYQAEDEIDHIDEDLDISLKFDEPYEEVNIQIRIEGKLPAGENDNNA